MPQTPFGFTPFTPPSGFDIFNQNPFSGTPNQNQVNPLTGQPFNYTPPPTPEPNPWISQGLRVGGGVIGGALGMLGGPAAPYTVPLGAGIGSALGELGGQIYDDRGINPLQVGVQGALGSIPGFIGKAPLPGAARSAFTNYALKQPLYGAAEGAILGASGAVPTQLAETGEMPTLGQVGESAWSGAKLGTLFGAGFGTPLGLLNRPRVTPDAPPPPRAAAPDLPLGAMPFEPPAPPMQEIKLAKTLEEAQNIASQGYMQAAEPSRGGQIQMATPEAMQRYGLNLIDPLHQGQGGRSAFFQDFTSPPAPEIPAMAYQKPKLFGPERPPFDPSTLPPMDSFAPGGKSQTVEADFQRAVENDAPIVPMSNPTSQAGILKSRGYVYSGFNSESAPNYPIFVKKEMKDQYAQQRSGVSRPEFPSATTGTDLLAGDEVSVPRKKVTEELINDYMQNGYNSVRTIGDTVVFSRGKGGLDVDPLMDKLRASIESGTANQTRGINPLPEDLKGAAPRYGKFKVEFTNPVDKAAYILAQDSPSKRDADYLRYVIRETGWDEATAREHGREVKRAIGEESFSTTGDTVVVPSQYDPSMNDSTPSIQEQESARTPPASFEGNPLAEGNIKRSLPKTQAPMEQQYADLTRAIDDAYRRNDMNSVIKYSQQRQEVLAAMGGKLPGRRGNRAEAAEMRVPGKSTGKSGLDDVKLGGASPRMWDIMATSLYSKDRPTVVVKELLQNSIDEHRTSGVTNPIRIVYGQKVKNPKTGKDSRSITVRDNGRGMTPDQLYTKMTDLGETGKADDPDASGGFGVAKAAPFGSGDYTKVRSVVMEGGEKVQYTFEGTFQELKDGVSLEREIVDDSIPTGMEVTTYFPKDTHMYSAEVFARRLITSSPTLKSIVLTLDEYDYNTHRVRPFLDENILPGQQSVYMGKNSPAHVEAFEPPKDFPKLRDTIVTPGAEIDIHYDDPTPGSSSAAYNQTIMNKGLYQATDPRGYGKSYPNVPDEIVLNIKATVEEGTEGYPFTANREQIDRKISELVSTWIKDNIKSGAEKKRVAELQKKYDTIATLPDSITHYYDDENLLTPDELNQIATHPIIQKVTDTLQAINMQMLEIADKLGWRPEFTGDPTFTPSGRLKKFGLLFQGPKNGRTTLGVHIPRADDLKDSAILINLMEHMNQSMNAPDSVDDIASALFATIAHEIAHVPGGTHDDAHSYRDAGLRSAIGGRRTVQMLDSLLEAFGGQNGRFDVELLDLLSVYNESRFRSKGGEDSLLATGINSERSTNSTRGTTANRGSVNESEGHFEAIKKRMGWGQGLNPEKSLMPKPESGKKPAPSKVEELISLPTQLASAADFSGVGRQGLATIFTPEFWKALGPMFKGTFSQEAANALDEQIRAKPLFRKTIDPVTHKLGPSQADKMGMKLADVGNRPSEREEGVVGKWVQSVLDKPGLKQIAGNVIRGSNRGYSTLLNHIRANRFEKLMNLARDSAIEASDTGSTRMGLFRQNFTREQAEDLNPYKNHQFAREIADFVNTATGRGPLKTHFLPYKGAGISLEKSARLLTNTMFAPRNIASKLRMLNPSTYIMATPYVRKQYLKSALAVGATWMTIAEMANLAGADVNLEDLTSADFGKIKIGDTRLDPGGGFQQFIVAMARLYHGGYTSSATGKYHQTGQGFQATTQKDIGERLFVNKLNPATKFAYDMLNASEYNPMHVGDRTAQLFIPLMVQDIISLSQEGPEYLPFAIPAAFGMGTQTYSKGESVSKIVPPKYDWIMQGNEGGKTLNPLNWFD